MGLSAPAVEKASVAKADFILVERYDRIRDSRDVIHKLHQEDFCQALRIPPELKYEEEGGPGIAHCQTIIQQHTGRPAAGRLTFLNRVIYNYLAGNADAHGKNYSLLYKTPTPDLAPVYDVVCTAAYPRLAKNLAMKIGGRAIPDTIQWEHWRSLVPDTKVAHRLLANTLAEMAESIEREADSLLAEMTHENIYHPVLKTVRKTIAARASLIRRILESAV